MRLFIGLFLALTFVTPTFANEVLDAASIVPEITQLGVAAEVVRLVDPRLNELSNEEDRYYLDIRLGRLTEEQFNKISELYGKFSRVTYNSNRNYNLLDFLPPAVQAVANQVVRPLRFDSDFLQSAKYQKILDENADKDVGPFLFALMKNGLGFSTNCWNTTSEILDLIHFPKIQDYNLMLPGRWNADPVLKDDDASSIVSEDSIKPWDALLVSLNSPASGNQELQHTALILNSQLVFEKTDSSENDPYRISLRTDVLNKYQRLFEGERVVEYRRYGKKPLNLSASGLIQPMPDVLKGILKKISPIINSDKIVEGCEVGLGGGCDLFLEEARPARVIISKKTQRGLLQAPQVYLKRFEALK